jgi:hypothetical protein
MQSCTMGLADSQEGQVGLSDIHDRLQGIETLGEEGVCVFGHA